MTPPFGLRILPAASRAVAEQAAYYKEKSGASLAQPWRSAVNEAIRSLRNLPDRGSPANFALPALRNIRILHIEGFPKHLIFYRFDSGTGIVSIITVIHGARDLEAILALDIRN